MSFKNILCFGTLNPDFIYFVDTLPDLGGDIRSNDYKIRPGGTATNCAENITNWGSGIIDSSDIIDKESHNLESLFSYLNRLPSYLKKMNSMITLKYQSSEICDATIIDGNLAIGETVIVFQRNGINWKIILIEFSKDFLRNKIK